ncbi:MAG: hypothetical protein US96_C0014G0015 [Candidatus Woesebacteria bacterium GW2011_GWB1_38_5b]|uniref:Uncharacterized protein n=1 Tax=Candidatus Woesebacteria bacterium GW2011_GWB1_38_5b TaxID=1618569 RepID=A0A0G0K8V3_9BACT|nr:MAG: hypothetical protein US96_C0014G0015 [Candidatus Woesebacteria bacterium GW2011_GWB1_38_5b]
MPEQPQVKEFISGPATLEEYLDHRGDVFKESVISYQLHLNLIQQGKAFGNRQGTQAIVDRENSRYTRVVEAKNQLVHGDNTEALALLREQEEELKRRVEHNKRYHNQEWAEEANVELIVLQMLEADVTGIEPKFYGIKLYLDEEKEEPYKVPETVKRSDLITASLFKTVYRLERDKELTSGMMYRPTSQRLLSSFDELFANVNALTDADKELLKKYISDIFITIKEFSDENLKANHDTSYPQSPIQQMKPNEIIRMRKPHSGSNTPNALIYLENNGELKYRFSVDPTQAERVFNLEQNTQGISEGTISKIEPLSKDLEGKVVNLLTSEEFTNHWKAPHTVYIP